MGQIIGLIAVSILGLLFITYAYGQDYHFLIEHVTTDPYMIKLTKIFMVLLGINVILYAVFRRRI